LRFQCFRRDAIVVAIVAKQTLGAGKVIGGNGITDGDHNAGRRRTLSLSHAATLAVSLHPWHNGNGTVVLTIGRRTASRPVIVDEPENMLRSVDRSAWRSLGFPLII